MMHLALKEAGNSKFPNFKLGAVLVKSGSVISKGHNQIRHCQFPSTGHWPHSLHAEVDAIRKAITSYEPNQLSKHELYVAKLAKSGRGTVSKPCNDCMDVIRYFGIKTIHYFDKNDNYRTMKL